MSRKDRWKIVGTFTTRTPMHIGSGDVFEKTFNHHKTEAENSTENQGEPEKSEVQAVVKDYAGKPCIPGTALKGVLRHWAEDWVLSQDSALTRIFGPDNCDHSGWVEFCTATLKSQANGEAFVPYWDPKAGTGILSHVAIDRVTGAAEKNKLYFEEFVPEGTVFKVTLAAANIDEKELAILLGLLKQSTQADQLFPLQFGANGADGWGQVDWKLERIETYDYSSHQYVRKNVSPMLLDSSEQPQYQSFTLTLNFNGPFLVNDTSKTHQKDDDKKPHFVALKRANGQVWLPASSFRGALRSRFEFLAKSQGIKAEVVESLFGHTGQAARLHIHEFTQTDDKRDLKHQDFVAIDRFTGGASDGAKFHANYADRPTFTTKLTFKDGDLSKEAKELLAATLHDLQQGKISFGFGSSKGYGEATGTLCVKGQEWVKLHIGEATSEKGSDTTSSSGPSLTKDIIDITANKNASAKPVKSLRSNRGKIDFKQLSKDLQDYHTIGSVDVEYELEKDQPVRIRFAGKEYIPVVSAAAAASAKPSLTRDRFAHPYYFLNAKDREQFTGDLADAKPIGHDQYKPGTYSGRLKIKLTTVTPLLLCNDSRATEDATQHKTYPVLKDRDGKPLLASSSVRGMLRSAYEAITNSRFGVFPIDSDNGHQNRLGLRTETRSSLDKVPVRIAMVNGTLQAQLLPGSTTVGPTGQPSQNQPLYAAWIAVYDRQWVCPGANNLTHGQEVWAYITPWRHQRGFTYWNVEAVSTNPQQPPPTSNLRPGRQRAWPDNWGQPQWVRGWYCRTERNIDNKHDERIFFMLTAAPIAELSENVPQQWRELITNYQNEHAEELRKGVTRPPALNTSCRFSRHITHNPATKAVTPSERELQEGTLAYANIQTVGSKRVVVALFPVSISRKLYDKSPLQLVPKKLLPATKLEELSPADRVFGWVSQDSTTGDNPAYCSQLRVGVVKCVTENAIENVKKTLAILGQPKPAQGRFYLGKADGTAQPDKGTKETRGYTGTNRIRGPKVYPHHATGLNPQTAYALPDKSQNRTIEGYVKPNTEFTFDLHFHNLSAFEVGALLWLLSLPPEHHLRLGLGKPLGFGSVTVSIDWEASKLALGEKWIECIGSANEPTTSVETKKLAESFAEVMTKANPDLLKGFLAACKGWKDLATHYPRLNGQPAGSGESYRWFVENDRVNGPGHSLPDLTNPQPGLPYLDEQRK